MENKNLEDIVFDRLCRYLKPFGVEIEYNDPYFELKLRIDDKPTTTHFRWWMSKKEMLMGFEYGEDFHMIRIGSIFTIFDDYICIYAAGGAGGRLFQVMVKVQQCLDAVKADSFEEMLLKMDLMGI